MRPIVVMLAVSASLVVSGCTAGADRDEASDVRPSAPVTRSPGPELVALPVCVGTQAGTPDSEVVRVRVESDGEVVLDRDIRPGTSFTLPALAVGSELSVALDGQPRISDVVRSQSTDFFYALGEGCPVVRAATASR